jgi:hypothetical protein
MKFSTLTNLSKFQLPAKALLSLLAIGLCLGAIDRASAITDSPIPGSITPSNTPINPASTIPGAVLTPAATCANVDVNIVNRTSDTVKVTKFEYFDTIQNIWIEKNILGANGVQQLLSGTNHLATTNFASIDGRNTRFKVTYQPKLGPNNFGPLDDKTTTQFRCIDGSRHVVNITP